MTDEPTSTRGERQVVEKIHESRGRIERELAKVIVGQKEATQQLLISLFAGGHCLITGAPGLAKTLLVRTIAQVFHLKFQRIQFTPDLMPADITGTEILEETGDGRRRMQFVKGPIFANVILADEINRTPPKTQAALLEAMQEHQVTAAGRPLSAGRAVLRPGHAEPDRDGGDLSPARGPARPVPVQRDRRLSARGRRGGGRPADDLAQARGDRAALRRRATCCSSTRSSARCRSPRTWSATPSGWRRRAGPGPEAPDFINDWVSWGAGLRAGAVAGAGRQGPGPAPRAGSTSRPRTSAPWSTPPSGTASCSATGPRPTASPSTP